MAVSPAVHRSISPLAQDRWFMALLAALALFQVLDVLLTWFGLTLSGNSEANPLGQAVLGSGLAGLAVAKALGTGLAVGITLYIRSQWPRIGQATATVGCAMMATVVAWNIFVILT